MIAILWQYRVKPEHRQEFETTYDPEGEWAQLFRREEGYIGTELLRGADGGYLTIDRWRSSGDFARFKEKHAGNYSALDARTEAWTEEETRLGTWEQPDLIAAKSIAGCLTG